MSTHRITPRAVLLAAAFVWLAAASPAAGDEAWNGETTTGINLRQAPSLSGTVITALEAGERLQVTASEGDWLQVVVNGDGYGFRGWVYGSYVRRIAAPPAADPAAPPAVSSAPLQPSPGEQAPPITPRPAPSPSMTAPAIPARPPSTVPTAPARGAQSPPPTDVPSETVPAPAAAVPAPAPAATPAPATTPDAETKTEPAAPATPAVATPATPRSGSVPAAAPVAATAVPSPGPTGFAAYLQLALRLATTILACMALLIALRSHRMARAAVMGVGETVPPSPSYTTAGRPAAGRLGPIRA